MTISSNTRKTEIFVGTGLVSEYSFTFKVFAAADLLVVQQDTSGVETTLTLDEDFSASLNANQNTNPGGSITLTSALPDSYTLVISTQMGYLQPTDLTNQGGFYPRVINDALDRLTILAQQLKEMLDRALVLPIHTPADVSPRLPAPQAGTMLGWSTDGKSIENYLAGDYKVLLPVAASQAPIVETSADHPEWTINGVNKVFTPTKKILPWSLRGTINGFPKGCTIVVATNAVTLSEAPQEGDSVELSFLPLD